MRYRQLGRSGLTVSVVGLGGNNFGAYCDAEQTRAVVDAAFEAGITLFDAADVYGNGQCEELLGAALKSRRDEIVLATKFGNPPSETESRTSRRYVRRAVEASLRRLQTDWIDLYQVHGPDARTPIEETLDALDDLVREGKIRYAGTSMIPPWQVVEAEFVSRGRQLNRFVSTQAHYSLLHRDPERELARACVRYQVGILPFFPLANGLLSGKYRRDQPLPEGTRITEERRDWLTEERLDQIEGLVLFAESRGLTLLDVAIGWLAAQPAVGSVIAGATRPEQVRANAGAASWIPTEEDRAEIDAIVPPPLQNLHRQRPAYTR